MTAYKELFSPLKLKNIELKNRLVSTAHACTYAESGKPGERYQAYHEEKAKGGMALTVFGGSSNVSRDSGALFSQLYLGDDEIIPYLRSFAERIHKYDCALMCQITHMGRRTSWQGGDWLSTVGASKLRDPAHHAMPKPLEQEDIERITKCFGDAALRCQEGGLDGCEVLATTHLLGQFLSPLSNNRDDIYGGDIHGRSRFLMEVLTEVRRRVGDDFIVGLRFTADESNEGGFDQEEGVEIARLIGQSGLVDFLNVNGAYGGTTKGFSETFPAMGTPSAPYIELAKKVRDASGLPTMQAARITDLATANHAVAEGCLDLVGMVRPHLADPYIAQKLLKGEEDRIRVCVGAGHCLDRVYQGSEMICIQNTSIGRETRFPEHIDKAATRQRIVVVGGGPAGMEASRVARLRGHDVVLFEALDHLGGQISLASKASWRRDMIGISDWLANELSILKVDVRYNVFAEKEEILAENPDVVIVATGGVPDTTLPKEGGDLASTTWDILSGQLAPADEVLIYDEVAGHAAISLADRLCSQNCKIELVCSDRMVARELGGQSYPMYLENLYRAKARLTPDTKLLGIQRQGNRLIAEMMNVYSREVTLHPAQQIVVDLGTVPNDEVFFDLKAGSRNKGQLEPNAFADGRPQPEPEAEGGYILYRIGDAVSCRDIYSAIFDGNRIARTL